MAKRRLVIYENKNGDQYLKKIVSTTHLVLWDEKLHGPIDPAWKSQLGGLEISQDDPRELSFNKTKKDQKDADKEAKKQSEEKKEKDKEKALDTLKNYSGSDPIIKAIIDLLT